MPQVDAPKKITLYLPSKLHARVQAAWMKRKRKTPALTQSAVIREALELYFGYPTEGPN